MAYAARAYRGQDDLRLIQEHIRDLWRADGPMAPIHPGDIAWWTRQHEKPAGYWEHRIRLWFQGRALVGWSVIGHPASLDAFPRADLRGSDLHCEMLDWFERVATDLADGPVNALTVYALEGEEASAALLRARGFSAGDGGSDQHVLRTAGGMPTVALPPGYAIRTVKDHEIEARVALHRAAFAPSRVTQRSYRALMDEGTYDGTLDHVVVAPDGSFAAFCIAWYDSATRAGLLEPVGTHPAHRRRGLARAVCAAAVRALAERGADAVVVLSDTGGPAGDVYRSVGFRTIARHARWTAPLARVAVA